MPELLSAAAVHDLNLTLLDSQRSIFGDSEICPLRVVALIIDDGSYVLKVRLAASSTAIDQPKIANNEEVPLPAVAGDDAHNKLEQSES